MTERKFSGQNLSAMAAEEAFSHSRWQEVIDVTAEAASASTGNLRLRGLALAKVGRLQEARTCLEKAALDAPSEPGTWSDLGNVLRRLGRGSEAQNAYHCALRADPTHRHARLNLALYHDHLGEHRIAVSHLLQLLMVKPDDAQAASALGAALLAMKQTRAAAIAFDLALVTEPTRPVALSGRARTSLELGESASRRYLQALEHNGGDHELLIGLAEALEQERVGQGSLMLRSLVQQHPVWLRGHQVLARMRFEEGDPDFASVLKAALWRSPSNDQLRIALVRLLRSAECHEEAISVLRGSSHDGGNGRDWQELEAALLIEVGEPAKAVELLAKQRNLWSVLGGRALLASGDAVQAIQALQRAIAATPNAIDAWAHLDLAWRAAGDDRHNWLSLQEELVVRRPLALTNEELQQLIAELRLLHKTRAPPLGQSIRAGGTQTRGRLFDLPNPSIRRLRRAVTEAIAGYWSNLPPFDTEHPFLRHRKARPQLAGSWSVRLTTGGHHAAHVHLQGLASSACHLLVPRELTEQGALEIGRPPPELNLQLSPLWTFIPEEGSLILFPSYLYHGTRPTSHGERLTVAFDVNT